MRLDMAALALTVSVICAAPAAASPIFTFGVDGTSDFDTDTIQSYSFAPAGAGGTLEFIKAIDASSAYFSAAVALGTAYPGATFIAFQDVVSPQTELFRYILTDVRFTSSSFNQLTQTVSLEARSAILQEGPAPVVPEPTSGLLFVTGVMILARRTRGAWTRVH